MSTPKEGQRLLKGCQEQAQVVQSSLSACSELGCAGGEQSGKGWDAGSTLAVWSPARPGNGKPRAVAAWNVCVGWKRVLQTVLELHADSALLTEA